MHLPLWRLVAASVFLSLGCASQHDNLPPRGIDTSLLPRPDTIIEVKGLGPCTDQANRSLSLNINEPVIVLVHGINSSPGQLRGLAQVLADQGQQSACFTYDDREDLNESSAELAASIQHLTHSLRAEITILGHSQGALLARKSLTDDSSLPAPAENSRLRLVTVSGPFAGIEAARRCGSSRAKVLSLGIVPLLCKLFTGEKWTDITYSSDFIKQPGRLRKQVHEYLKIDTDERNACRRSKRGQCIESDYVFTLDEQRNQFIERSVDTQTVEIKAGHTEIVGINGSRPSKLISILQEKSVIRAAEPIHATASDDLLAGNSRTER